MPGLVKRTVRTTQPQTAVGIDWSNPITKGLKALVGPSFGKALIGKSTSYESFLLTQGSVGINKFGKILYTGSNATSQKLTVTTDPFDASECTMLFFGYSASNISYPDFISIGNGSTSFFALERASNVSTNGSFAIYGLTAPFVSGTATSSGIGLTGQTPSIIVATASVEENATRLYAYGRQYASGSWVGAPTTATSTVFFGRHGTGDRTLNTSGMLLSGVWDRALSSKEVRSLSDNIWQIFQPDVSYLDAIYQERITISPDESRWMGAHGRSTEVSEVIQKHTSIRTSQPQGPVEIDWGNSITKGLVSAIIPGTSNSDIVNKKPFNATNPKKVYSSGVAVNTSNYGQKTNSFPKLSIDATILWIGVIDVQASTGQLLTNRWAYHGTGIPIGLCSYTSPARAGFNVLGISNALIFPITTLPGNLVSFIGKRSNTLGSLFENGVLLGTGTFNTTPIVNDDVFPLTFGSLSNDTNGEKIKW